jgi:hypothetical protein
VLHVTFTRRSCHLNLQPLLPHHFNDKQDR